MVLAVASGAGGQDMILEGIGGGRMFITGPGVAGDGHDRHRWQALAQAWSWQVLIMAGIRGGHRQTMRAGVWSDSTSIPLLPSLTRSVA